MSRLWSDMVKGDVELFVRRFLFINAAEEQDMGDLLFGTEIRRRHSTNYICQFARLIENANACDPDGMLTDAICDSAFGRLYEIMVQFNNHSEKH